MIPQDPTIAVEIENAHVHYGKVCAVEAVHLQIQRGSIHVLLGRSGSGKTTLLRAIAGFEPLRTGSIKVHGRPVDLATRESWVAPENRKIGFVFQDYALFPHLDVVENIAFGAPGKKADRKETAANWLGRVRLKAYGSRKPGELSGGEQQRVALARVLAQGTDLLLFDEPFSNLDAHLRRRVREETIELIRENSATAIFVTHDSEEAFAIADYLTVLHDAKVEQTGTPRQIYKTPASIHVARLCGQATFLPIQEVIGTNRAKSLIGEVETVGNLRPNSLLVIRPESLTATDSQDMGIEIIARRYLGSSEEIELRLSDEHSVLIRQAPDLLGHDATHVGLKTHGPFAVVDPLTT